ncbi:MAG: DUF484 family protein [Pseudomonadales bacterium]|uniref:DUF484 family protein n=1 Tax=Alcanivorax sp. MD8A TaxID=1177157 RepID=UPI000C9C325E|nr:DUF484 family protein [Alcanivorax sp. MD8A]MCG8439760.1 DUF484 family protein [Pseudomonadales bacterium]MEE2870694.1 DUF484 family protein [Pseudomonadota bacterium]PNE02809.1 hypothetical protein A15D_01625 [Alcanivorax sp. MD8A]
MTDHSPANADQVAAYLRDNPEFFEQRPELLELLRLPDSKGEAVSLLERQASILRERNTELRDRLNGLLDVARENDHLFDKTRRLTLALLEARGAEKLFRNLLTSLGDDFRCDRVSLMLYDREVPILGDLRNQIRCVDSNALPQALNHLLRNGKAVCGAMRQEEMEALFKEHATDIRSAAMVPLEYQGRLGLLAIGSKSAMHFRSSLGTLFITHIGQVLSRRLHEVLRQYPHQAAKKISEQ